MISFMAMGFFAKSPVLLLPLLSLGLFMSVFVAVALRTALTKKARFDALASMPLRDDRDTVRTEEVGRGQ